MCLSASKKRAISKKHLWPKYLINLGKLLANKKLAKGKGMKIGQGQMKTLENGNGITQMTFHAPSVTLNIPLLYLDLINIHT